MPAMRRCGARRRSGQYIGAPTTHRRRQPAVRTVPVVTADARRPTVLFTAFEPSGDDLAGAVAAEIRRRDPAVRLCAWGGPRLRQAGAEVVEDTGHEAVMGIPGPRVVRDHLRMLRRIEAWMSSNRPDVHVPVDSPAANFPVCRISRRVGARVCHLVAPQLWAWAPWRIRKLRRLTDHVLCLLPFEETWFNARGVRATFVGHPIFDAPADEGAIRARCAAFASGSPRVALLPGSRPKEHERNFPVMLDAFRDLCTRHPGLAGRIAAVNSDGERRLRALAGSKWPDRLEVTVGDVEAVIAWSDLCLAVSGTVTLHVLRQERPMVVMFKASPLTYHLLGRWLIYADFLAMPNLLAGKRIVPELMPYFGGPGRLIDEAERLISSTEAREAQRAALAAVRAPFEGMQAASNAADAILEMIAGAARAERVQVAV